MLQLRHVCDTGSEPVLRVLKSTDEELIVETTARRLKRILKVDLRRGAVEQCNATTPLLDISRGERWIAKANSGRRGGSRSTEISWQDRVGGPIYTVDIPGEECVSLSCPSSGTDIFVGGRRSAENGEGSIYCLNEGLVRWSYRPEEVAEYPSYTQANTTRLLKAYPYRIVSSRKSHAAFSFLNYLYVLDDAGQLIGKWSMGSTLDSEFNGSFFTPSKSETTREDEKFRLSFSIKAPMYEPPVVTALAASDEGNVFVAASKTALLWITPSGQIAHSCELPIGQRNGIGVTGQISRLEVLGKGETIVAEVADSGFASIQDGVVATVHEVKRHRTAWDLCRQTGLIAMSHWDNTTLQGETIKLYDLDWRPVASFHVSSGLSSLRFSEDGKYLLLSGNTPSIWRLDN